MHDFYYVMEDDVVIDVWPVIPRVPAITGSSTYPEVEAEAGASRSEFEVWAGHSRQSACPRWSHPFVNGRLNGKRAKHGCQPSV